MHLEICCFFFFTSIAHKETIFFPFYKNTCVLKGRQIPTIRLFAVICMPQGWRELAMSENYKSSIKSCKKENFSFSIWLKDMAWSRGLLERFGCIDTPCRIGSIGLLIWLFPLLFVLKNIPLILSWPFELNLWKSVCPEVGQHAQAPSLHLVAQLSCHPSVDPWPWFSRPVSLRIPLAGSHLSTLSGHMPLFVIEHSQRGRCREDVLSNGDLRILCIGLNVLS